MEMILLSLTVFGTTKHLPFTTYNTTLPLNTWQDKPIMKSPDYGNSLREIWKSGIIQEL